MSDTYTVLIEVPEDADIEEAGTTVELDVPGDETVLAAARAAGLWLPADCQQGWCCTCAAELLEGEVDQSRARRYYEVDREENMILPCTGLPESDLRLRACQYEEMLEHRAEHDLPPGRAKR